MRLFAAVVLFLTLSLAYGWNDTYNDYFEGPDGYDGYEPGDDYWEDHWEESSAGYLQTTCSLIVPALYLLVKSA